MRGSGIFVILLCYFYLRPLGLLRPLGSLQVPRMPWTRRRQHLIILGYKRDPCWNALPNNFCQCQYSFTFQHYNMFCKCYCNLNWYVLDYIPFSWRVWFMTIKKFMSTKSWMNIVSEKGVKFQWKIILLTCIWERGDLFVDLYVYSCVSLFRKMLNKWANLDKIFRAY